MVSYPRADGVPTVKEFSAYTEDLHLLAQELKNAGVKEVGISPALGLLRPSHIAEESYRELRTYLHERNTLQGQKSDTLNRMQKVLSQMNIKVQHIICDIEGGGMQLLRSIAAAETNVEGLLSALNPKRLKATQEELTKSLQGQFKPHCYKSRSQQVAIIFYHRMRRKTA